MTGQLITGFVFAPTSWSVLELIIWGALILLGLWIALHAVIFVVAFLQLIWKNIIPDLIKLGKKIFRSMTRK